MDVGKQRGVVSSNEMLEDPRFMDMHVNVVVGPNLQVSVTPQDEKSLQERVSPRIKTSENYKEEECGIIESNEHSASEIIMIHGSQRDSRKEGLKRFLQESKGDTLNQSGCTGIPTDIKEDLYITRSQESSIQSLPSDDKEKHKFLRFGQQEKLTTTREKEDLTNGHCNNDTNSKVGKDHMKLQSTTENILSNPIKELTKFVSNSAEQEDYMHRSHLPCRPKPDSWSWEKAYARGIDGKNTFLSQENHFNEKEREINDYDAFERLRREKYFIENKEMACHSSYDKHKRPRPDMVDERVVKRKYSPGREHMYPNDGKRNYDNSEGFQKATRFDNNRYDESNGKLSAIPKKTPESKSDFIEKHPSAQHYELFTRLPMPGHYQNIDVKHADGYYSKHVPHDERPTKFELRTSSGSSTGGDSRYIKGQLCFRPECCYINSIPLVYDNKTKTYYASSMEFSSELPSWKNIESKHIKGHNPTCHNMYCDKAYSQSQVSRYPYPPPSQLFMPGNVRPLGSHPYQ